MPNLPVFAKITDGLRWSVLHKFVVGVSLLMQDVFGIDIEGNVDVQRLVFGIGNGFVLGLSHLS